MRITKEKQNQIYLQMVVIINKFLPFTKIDLYHTWRALRLIKPTINHPNMLKYDEKWPSFPENTIENRLFVAHRNLYATWML